MPYGGHGRLFEAYQHSRDISIHQPGRGPERIPDLRPSVGQSLFGQLHVSLRSRFRGVPEDVGLQILLTRSDQEPKRTVANGLANMNPLSGYLIDGGFLVRSPLFSRHRSRKQAFRRSSTVSSRIKYSQSFAASHWRASRQASIRSKTNTASTIPKRCSVKSSASTGTLPCARARARARRNSATRAVATTTKPKLRRITNLS